MVDGPFEWSELPTGTLTAEEDLDPSEERQTDTTSRLILPVLDRCGMSLVLDQVIIVLFLHGLFLSAELCSIAWGTDSDCIGLSKDPSAASQLPCNAFTNKSSASRCTFLSRALPENAAVVEGFGGG